MKSEQEIKQMLNDIHIKIYNAKKACDKLSYGGDDWFRTDREYAKLIAQYNILLEVLR